jgi:apolipoprotein N-acyltransferase
MARRDPPSTNGEPAASRPAAPEPLPEAPPSRLGTLLVCAVMFTWTLAFAPEPVALATVPGLIAWLALMERCRSIREVLFWTATFGALAIGYGYRWLAPTVQLFGGLDAVSAWAVTALYGVLGVVHGWVFAIFYRSLLRRGRRPHPLYTVILVVAVETLPIRLFPWMVGHGAIDVPPLVQAAEWGGVPGVSLVFACLIVPVHEWLVWVFARRGPAARPGAALATFALGVLLFGFGALRYGQVRDEDAAATRHLRVGIVQANVGSLDKRDATENGGSKRARSIAAYERGSREAAREGAELVVWPETAITDGVPLDDALQTNNFLRGRGYEFLSELGEQRAFLVGLYELVTGRRSTASGRWLDNRYNVAALRQPGGAYAAWSRYRKVYLIPFGEMMPFGLFEDRLPQNFKMEAGAEPQPLLSFKGLTFAPFLCYEGILADYVRAYVGETRPDVLVSMANDSWFGDTWEPHQHLNFTRFRAVEHRAPLVRATNTGISAFVGASGDVEARIGVGGESVLVREVPLVDRGRTVYARFGHHLPLLCWLLALGGFFAYMMRPPPLVSDE